MLAEDVGHNTCENLNPHLEVNWLVCKILSFNNIFALAAKQSQDLKANTRSNIVLQNCPKAASKLVGKWGEGKCA